MESIEGGKSSNPTKGQEDQSTDIIPSSECLWKGDIQKPHPTEYMSEESEWDSEVIHQTKPLNVNNEPEQVAAPEPPPVVDNPPQQPPPTPPA